jgi:serine phosphatase RsbU (regulator of sigma subunit)
MLSVEVAVAKVGKYASSESGDTFEMVERPRGGISLVLADGQRSGKGAKFISNMVSRKAMSLLGEGVRGAAAAQAAHDYLFAYRGGRVSSTLNIATIDLDERRLQLCRNNPVPVYVCRPEGIEVLDEPSQPVGFYADTTPVLATVALEAHTYVVMATDGLAGAGQRAGKPLDLRGEIATFFELGGRGAERLADGLLSSAWAADAGRPADDVSVVVIAATPEPDDVERPRRLLMRLPMG